MIIAGVAVLLSIFGLGGGTVALESLFGRADYVADNVSSVIDDDKRVAAVQAHMADIDKVFGQVQSEMKSLSKQITQLDGSPSSTREDYKSVVQQCDDAMTKAEDRVVEILINTRKDMTAKEWKAVYELVDKQRQ